MLLSLIVAVILSVLAVFFANDNQAMVGLQLFGLQIEGKLGVVVVVGFALGAVMGIAGMLPAYLAQGWSLIRTRRKLEDLQRGGGASIGSNAKQV